MQNKTREILKAAAAALQSAAAAAAFALFALPAHAAHPDSDAITISITPMVEIGVDVDTATARFFHADAPGTMDLSLDLGATAYFISPASVTILGNIQPQELDLSAQLTGGWTLDADELVGTDELQAYALFAADKASRPSEAEFAGVKNLLTATPKRAGRSPGVQANGNFENDSMAGSADMDNILLSSPTRQLWLRLDLPAYSTTDQTQTLTVTINATRTGL